MYPRGMFDRPEDKEPKARTKPLVMEQGHGLLGVQSVEQNERALTREDGTRMSVEDWFNKMVEGE